MAAAAAALALAAPASAASPDVVVSEVYGGGGNNGATYTNDYIELYNPSATAVPVDGWSVQYASAAGSSWAKTDLAGSIAPGAHYLVQEGAGAGGTTALPKPDATGGIAMSATAGKVALVTSTTNLTCSTGCATAAGVRDFVGFGSTASSFEGAGPAPAPSNTTSDSRIGTDTDQNAVDFTAGSPDPQSSGGGTPPPPPGLELRIHEIQGTSHKSPHVGDRVAKVPGIVTARGSNGFWMQDRKPDDDVRTSEGIFVFTRSAPPAVAAVGSPVRVDGLVAEFRASATNLSTTEIDSPTVTADPEGAGTIDATVIGAGGRVPPTQVIDHDSTGDVDTNPTLDPEQDGIDFDESLEGMLVQLNDAIAVGPTNSFGETPVVGDRGELATPRSARGGVVATPGDFNPERLIVDDTLARMPASNVGDTYPGPLRAVVDYAFGNYMLHALETPAHQDGGLQREVTDPASGDQLSIASFNVENLDPTDPPDKFDRLANILVGNLQSPDLVAVEEIQDDDGPGTSPSTDATVTWNELIAAIKAAGGPDYDYREIDPEYGTDGGEPGGNIRQGFLYRTDRGLSFVDRPGGTATSDTTVAGTGKDAHLSASPGRIAPTAAAFEDSRKPLAGEFRWHNKPVFVVANHFNSKGGDDPLFGRFQPPEFPSENQRHQQAAIVNGFVSDLEAANPRANVVVLGDLNDFDFSETLSILKGDQLVNLMDTLPLNERYSYVYEGNSEVLDQILVSQPLLQGKPAYDSVHVNAEFTDQASDHDPQVARLRVLGPAAP
jgi:predicted extracellular nuclease